MTLATTSPLVLFSHPSVPAATIKELIGYAKANPGKLNYASSGPGSSPHLATELFRSLTGADIVHVPYSGGGPATVGVMGGSMQMLFASVLPVLGLVKSGKLKAIAIASDKRSPLMPDAFTWRTPYRASAGSDRWKSGSRTTPRGQGRYRHGD